MSVKPKTSRSKSRTKRVKETVAIALKKPAKPKSRNTVSGSKTKPKDYLKLVHSR